MKSKLLKLKAGQIPLKLREIPQPPKTLHVRGELPDQKQLLLAVVGSRKVSSYGRQVTEKLVSEVVSRGVGIVSGLALGVDGLAHTAALDANGYTLAVMPCGLDEIYPKSHFHLGKRILQQSGALLSEYSSGTPPLRQHFIERNRLVSGIADAVLITEAAAKSGTLHTANFALDQGKTVLAVPGNITNANSQGTNSLIKAGAIPVTDISDILLALGIDETSTQTELFGDDQIETTLLKLLQAGTADATELQTKTNLTSTEFNQALSMLEIKGRIKSLGANQWAIRR